MSTYKVRFVPGGVIPGDVAVGIHLQPQGSPGGCVDLCDGWAVTVDSVPATGDFVTLPNGATSISISLLGKLCQGHSVGWDLRQLTGDPSQLADFTATPSGSGVDIVGAGAVDYSGLQFGAYPTIGGKPFCVPIIFGISTVCVPTGIAAGWWMLLDPIDPISSNPPVEPATPGAVNNETTFPNRAFEMDFSPDVYANWFNVTPSIGCSDLLSATLSFAGGNPAAYGDFFIQNTSTGNAVCRLMATGVNDYTGITVSVNPFMFFDSGGISPSFNLTAV